MFEQLLTIGRNTFLESIRQPIFVVLLFVTSLALSFNPMLSAYTLDNDNKLMVDMGLSTLFLSGLLLAAFTATGVLNREVQNKTVLTVVSKPVSRPTFVIGKFVGVAAAITVAFWILGIIFLLTVRHKVLQTAADHFDMPVITFGGLAVLGAVAVATAGNYFYHWVFTSTLVGVVSILLGIAILLVLVIGPEWQFQSPAYEFGQEGAMPNGQLLVGMILILQGLLFVTAIAIAASTRLGQVMTLMVCFGVFILGLISDYMLGRFAETSLISDIFYRIIPNVQLFYPADAITQGRPIPGMYVAWVTGYTALFIAAVLSLAVALFQTREVG